MRSTIFTPILIFCLVTSLAQAQPNNPYGAKSPPRIELEGKLQAWQGGMMRIVNSAGQPVMFALPQSPNGIRFTAPVELGVLRKGMIVRIQAPVGPNGQFLEPINAMTLFTPDTSKMRSPVERSMNVPGFYRMNDIQRPAPGELGSPDVRIVGSIIGIEPNALALQCGNKPMKLDISESPKIELTASTLEFAKPGDHVKANAVANPASNQLAAISVTIQAAKPIAAQSAPMASTESVKLRVKETPKSKLKTPEMKEAPESAEKPEGKVELKSETPEPNPEKP